MNFSWMLGLIIFSQQVNMLEDVLITNNCHQISVVNRTNFSMQFPVLPILDTETIEKFMDKLDQQVTKNPNNAIIDNNGNIIPEQVGYRLNRQVFTEKIFSYYFNNGSSKLEIPLEAIYPRVDSELLGNIKSEKIGEYVTFFNSNNKERKNNIYLAVKLLIILFFFQVKHFPLIKCLEKEQQEKDICLPL